MSSHNSMAINENDQFNYQNSAFAQEDFSILPCEGIYKLTGKNEPVAFTYCRTSYWQCPNSKCIMQLV